KEMGRGDHSQISTCEQSSDGTLPSSQGEAGAAPRSAPRPGLDLVAVSPSFRNHHFPVFGIDFHGSWGGSGAPFCRSSTDCRSGERTKAITPSRGGRLMVTPAFISRSQVA